MVIWILCGFTGDPGKEPASGVEWFGFGLWDGEDPNDSWHPIRAAGCSLCFGERPETGPRHAKGMDGMDIEFQ